MNILPEAPLDGSATEAVIETLVAAFEDDCAVRMIYPADDEYRTHFAGFLVAFGGRAFEDGVVDRDTAGEAAAMWFPPGVEPDGEAIMAYLESTVSPPRFVTLARGMEIQSTFHPETEHWYLPWIGVRPGSRGQGIGRALLEYGLARADEAGMPAYLEATSRRNAALYERHGFEVAGVVESPGYPEIIAMWRPAAR
jgi:ribosomal protein S18 acetylase RimI-like enzyme